MIRAVYRAPDGHVQAAVKPEEFAAFLREEGGLLWVDMRDEPVEACEPILRDTFGFHPLAVADALEQTHVPKVDDWVEYIYLVLHAVTFEEQGEQRVGTLELDAFLGKNYLVTYQASPIAAVERVWNACQKDERHLRKGAVHLLYLVADELVTDYMPVIEGMDEAIDEIEDQVFGNPMPSQLAQISVLKRSLLHLRRIIAPQREVLNKLARGDYAVVDAEDRVFFRDVYDHLVRFQDITESLRDLVGGTLETYLSVVNNRMNEVMKILTVITTLFMPIAFLTGFFGMNFFQPVLRMDAWTGKVAFGLLLAGVVAVPIGMYLWMRRRAWM